MDIENKKEKKFLYFNGTTFLNKGNTSISEITVIEKPKTYKVIKSTNLYRSFIRKKDLNKCVKEYDYTFITDLPLDEAKKIWEDFIQNEIESEKQEFEKKVTNMKNITKNYNYIRMER